MTEITEPEPKQCGRQQTVAERVREARGRAVKTLQNWEQKRTRLPTGARPVASDRQ